MDMTHYRLRDLRDKWAGKTDSVIYLAPPKPDEPIAPKVNRTKKAYDLGYAARLAGRPQHTCPHNAVSAHKRHAAWRMGWSQADRESQSAVAVHQREHPVGYVPGVWKDLTTLFGSALLAYKFQRKSPRQKVADWATHFRSRSGWKPY
jgi:ribosome modulation factor